MFSINKTTNMLPLFFTSYNSAATCLKTHIVPVERSQLCFLVCPALPGPGNQTWSGEGMKRTDTSTEKLGQAGHMLSEGAATNTPQPQTSPCPLWGVGREESFAKFLSVQDLDP